MRDDEPRPVWIGTLEEPGTLTQGAPVFPGSSRLGIEPKTPGWLVQDPTIRLTGCVCFITPGPITKLFAWGEEESGGHVPTVMRDDEPRPVWMSLLITHRGSQADPRACACACAA